MFQRIYKPDDKYAVKDWVMVSITGNGIHSDNFMIYVGDQWYVELCTVCLN